MKKKKKKKHMTPGAYNSGHQCKVSKIQTNNITYTKHKIKTHKRFKIKAEKQELTKMSPGLITVPENMNIA